VVILHISLNAGLSVSEPLRSENSVGELWSVTSWLVANSWLVAAFVDVHALVVAEILTATSLEHVLFAPFGCIASESLGGDVVSSVFLLAAGLIARDLITGVDESVGLGLLAGVV